MDWCWYGCGWTLLSVGVCEVWCVGVDVSVYRWVNMDACGWVWMEGVELGRCGCGVECVCKWLSVGEWVGVDGSG